MHIRYFYAQIKQHCWIIVASIALCALIAYLFQHQNFSRQKISKDDFVHADELDRIAERLEKVRTGLQGKEHRLNELYAKVLYTRGRLTSKTIVLGNASRLSLADSTLRPSRAGGKAPQPVSRSYARHDSTDFDVTMPSAVTAYELDLVFEDTPLHGLGKDFVAAELETGINAAFLAALAIHESNWGGSVLSREHNNLFGFGAYDRDPSLANTFASKREGIIYVARFLREHYIDGSYSHGHTVRAINTLYSTDQSWSEKILISMLRIDETIQSRFAAE